MQFVLCKVGEEEEKEEESLQDYLLWMFKKR